LGVVLCCADSNNEVPDGDWYCWFCAKEHHKAYQHPKAQASSAQLTILSSRSYLLCNTHGV